jgi:hypothetical protein
MDHIENKSPTGTIAPNPLAIYSIIAAVLANFAGVLTRSLEGTEPGQEPGSLDARSIKDFSEVAEKTLVLQGRQQSLLSETESGQKPVYPIGVQALRWSTSDQVETYKNLRDQALDLFKHMTDLTIQTPRLKISSLEEEELHHALETIQSSIYQVQSSETYGESSTSLANSLQATVSAFEGLLLRRLPPGTKGTSISPKN